MTHKAESADPIFEALCRSRTFLEWLDDGTNEGVNDLLKIIKEGIAQREKEPQFTESKVYTGLQLIPTGERPGEYWFTDNFGKRLFRVSAS